MEATAALWAHVGLMRRSSENRNVGSLLREYGLTACIVPLEDFMDQADIDHLSTHIELSIMKVRLRVNEPTTFT